MTATNYSTVALPKLLGSLLNALDARSKDVITRRYGLRGSEVETLEAIGKEYGITRERVRQIQSQAMKVLRDNSEVIQPMATLVDEIFTAHGGILTEVQVVSAVRERLGQNDVASYVAFFLDLLTPYAHVTRDSYFKPHWRLAAAVSEYATSIVETAKSILSRAKHPISESELVRQVRESLKLDASVVPDIHILSLLTASKAVQRTPFGEWGLTGWPETNPRGVGDKAYAVLRRHGKPEHFTMITQLINGANFDHKQANAQTVHNELIKDDRFVLVGRGMYGLVEWGFIPGTVADVIESLLAKASEPLSREEVVRQVLEQRHVKKNTVLLGLQNHKRFVKTEGNRYSLRT